MNTQAQAGKIFPPTFFCIHQRRRWQYQYVPITPSAIQKERAKEITPRPSKRQTCSAPSNKEEVQYGIFGNSKSPIRNFYCPAIHPNNLLCPCIRLPTRRSSDLIFPRMSPPGTMAATSSPPACLTVSMRQVRSGSNTGRKEVRLFFVLLLTDTW